jgi:hypothetical protein
MRTVRATALTQPAVQPGRPGRVPRASLAHIPSTGDWPMVSEARYLEAMAPRIEAVVAQWGAPVRVA